MGSSITSAAIQLIQYLMQMLMMPVVTADGAGPVAEDMHAVLLQVVISLELRIWREHMLRVLASLLLS